MTTLLPRDQLRREFDAVVIDLDQSRTKPMLTTDFYRCIGGSVFDAGYRAIWDFGTHYNYPDFDSPAARMHVVSAPVGSGKTSFSLALVAALVRSQAAGPRHPMEL
jgi:hypothetical protein